MSRVKPVERYAMELLVSGQYGGSRAWKGKRSQLVNQTVYDLVHYIYPLPLYVCEINGLCCPIKILSMEEVKFNDCTVYYFLPTLLQCSTLCFIYVGKCFAMPYSCQW